MSSQIYSQSVNEACFSDVDNEIQGRWENPEDLITPYYVNLYFHIIRDNNGNGGAPASRVTDIMDQLNDGFNSHGIYFSNNDPINYIDNSFWFNVQWGAASASIDEHSDGIDIYLYPETESCASAAAYCTGNSNLGVLFMGTLRSTGFKLSEFAAAHEMGHMLGLPHTFETEFGIEKVNGSNCLTAGDRFCDTPASPSRKIYLPCADLQVSGGLNFEVSAAPNCQWLNPDYEDVTGLRYQPDSTNYMDYSHPSCYSRFSSEQVKAMRAKIERSNHLDEVVCSYIKGTYTLPGGTPQPLNHVNFVSNQTIDIDVDALHASSIDWQKISSAYVSWVTYNSGKEMSLYLSYGNSAEFQISYDNPCDIGTRNVHFIYYGGWYSVNSNPTFDCVDVQAEESYEVTLTPDAGISETLEVDPRIRNYRLLDQQGNIMLSEIYSGKG